MYTPSNGDAPQKELRGLSTDQKPMNVENGSIFYEMDTQNVYMFDGENNAWINQGGE